MGRQDQAAIEAVASHFAARWEVGEEPGQTNLIVGGNRVAVDVVSPRLRLAGQNPAKPALRFDRVALRLIHQLRVGLRDVVPDGEAVIFGVTAPIRLPAKTAAALEDKIRTELINRSGRSELRDTIHGNDVRVRITSGKPGEGAAVVGFVHNPGYDPELLFDATQSLVECIGGSRIREKRAGDRWLVITGESALSATAIYRQAFSQLSAAIAFDKIVMVLANGRVEILRG
jgi:hypothetical protein